MTTRYRLTAYKPGKDSTKYHQSTSRDRLVVAPIRSGKSYTILYEALVTAFNNPTSHPVLITAPTYPMLKEILEQPLVELAKELNIYKANNYSDHNIELINGKRLVFRSLENETKADKVRGITAYAAFCDEVAMCTREAIDLVRGRLLNTLGRLTMITTPRGFSNWVYEDYYSPEAKYTGDQYTELFKFSIFNNPTVTAEAVERFKQLYDPLLYKQEILGEWVNILANAVYHSFDREVNVTEDMDTSPKFTNIYAGVDYNLDINAAIITWKDYKGHVHVFDELVGYTTVADLGHALKNKYGAQLIVCDDASGGSRNQGDGRTNRQILQQCGLHNIVQTTSNPARVERYANVNAMLKNAAGNSTIHIHPKCKHLIKDLSELSYKKGTDIPNTLNNKLGHASDGLGYLLEYIAPFAGREFSKRQLSREERANQWLHG
jgi:hypothetical protein